MAIKRIMLASCLTLSTLKTAIDEGMDAAFEWPTERDKVQSYCQDLADAGDKLVAVTVL